LMDSGPWSKTAWSDCIRAWTVDERHHAEGRRRPRS